MRRLLFFSALVFAITLAFGAPAGAQTEDVPEYGGNPPTDVDPDEVINTGGEPQERVLGDVATRSAPGGGLPVTGGDLLGLTVVGLGAIGVGTVLVGARRRMA